MSVLTRQHAGGLSEKSLERFLRDIGIRGDLADVRYVTGPESDYSYVPVKGIDVKVEWGFPLYVPSKGAAGKEHIHAVVRGKKWVLRSARWDYGVKQFIVECVDPERNDPDDVNCEVVLMTVPLLRVATSHPVDVHTAALDGLVPCPRSGWITRLWRGLTATLFGSS